ncbi:class I SAM-dependent methyltransferase [Nostoc sp. UHCC 0251]|uniref:class I SAM-dependent methyltransferase n=1 Tax=Nostoc sp. UHCC 0251 TaxID=3110240 RepID=UPI002B207AF0|nr:class I SAM-dependent methyltransferase [Nostoc sp. UHCC 0251]MEA5628415.1 class I SAM-dependent methyltransferase [Nostoc sp. UHCC 0251]
MSQEQQISTRKIFSEIYTNNTWGGNSGEFYSGKGSNIDFSQQYCELIKNFALKIATANITIVDLGCGDFRVGQNLLQTLEVCQIKYQYIGVDIVPELVERNNIDYANTNIKFVCLDMIEQDLPKGDICLIRQVLQHLSNQDIKKILEKIPQYDYTFITEALPDTELDYVPNVDIPTGADIRLKHDSGVILDKHPFNVDNIELVLKIPYIEENLLYGRKTKLCTFKIEK